MLNYTTLVCQSWFGELSFETAPQFATEGREAIHASERIRVLQERAIDNQCVAVLRCCSAIEESDTVYAVRRAFHGKDEDSGQLISDLTLEVKEL
ncbi:MAG: hypothetical protein RR482_00060 [Clostridia bacterium]